MAAAYWMAHGTKAFFPIANQGEMAALYCFVFLMIAAHGAGIWSVDGSRRPSPSLDPAFFETAKAARGGRRRNKAQLGHLRAARANISL
jgi:hypothetical protein